MDGRNGGRSAVRRPIQSAKRDERRSHSALREDHELAKGDAAARRRRRERPEHRDVGGEDRKSTRLNSSHSQISYAVFCLKKKKNKKLKNQSRDTEINALRPTAAVNPEKDI